MRRTVNYNRFTLTRVWAIVLLIGIITSVSCGDDDNKSTDSGNNGSSGTTVVIDNFAFSPQTLTVSVGETVTWRNNHSTGHTVTSDQGSELGSALLNQGQTYQHTFDSEGIHPYHCSIHPSTMKGTITVVSAPGRY